jgi:dipeptidyl aminopeptidase/acylaminoacyl peptidase
MKQLFAAFLLIGFFPLLAQDDLGYKLPSTNILSLADYERAPSISMDSKKENMLLSYSNTYKSLEDLSIEDMKLGGLRIDPKNYIASTITYVNNLKLRKINDIKSEPVQVKGLPEKPKITNISWSFDDKKIAFTHTTGKGVELWMIDVASNTANKIHPATLNCNLGSPYSWVKNENNLLVRVLPANQNIISAKDVIPSGPISSSSDGKVSQNRTYQDLLKNKVDEQNFQTLVTSELHKLTYDGKSSLFMPADMYMGTSYSPDGNYLMITKMEKPFSYIVPFSRFPQSSVVYRKDGSIVRDVNDVPLVETMAKGFSATRPGKRSMIWRGDKAASLYYMEALDNGDPAVKADFRDELFTWDAPFISPATSLAKSVQRMGGVSWGDANTAIFTDSWYDTRNTKTYLFNPSNPSETPKIIFDRNSQDTYSNPGSFETEKNEFGRYVLAEKKNKLFLVGEGFSKEGQNPFIDEYDLTSLKTKRLYQSKLTDKKENIMSIEDFNDGKALVMIQSKNEYPNYYFRSYKNNNLTQITNTKNPFESIKNVYKEVIKYKREDGVELSGTLYLPVGYDREKKEKLPLLIWAYPEEFKDKASAGQVTLNPNDFTFPNYGSFVYWVNKGYAVLDDASFPIIGEGDKEPNDTYIQQLVANGKAAIDAVDNLGFIDRTKVAVGGHSYGAFMTANLLTHCDLFACGIARSGAYNRTLTPFGFQSEQRNLWDAPEVYNTMSPFYNAQKMKKPILLIHGEADNNPGTFTLQTERYYQAIKGLGGNARMVILPKEAHGYQAKENIMHMLWEQEQFLDKHLKNKGA